MRGEVAEKNRDRCFRHHLMDTVHGADLALVEQSMHEMEGKVELELDDDDNFHLRVLGEDDRTSPSSVLALVRGFRVNRWIIRFARSRMLLCPQ